MSKSRRNTRPAKRRTWLVDTQLARLPAHTSLQALSRYLHGLSVSALLADNTGSYVIANRAAVRLMGYSADELCAMSVWDLVGSVDEREAEVLWRNFVRAGTQRGIIKLRTKKGGVITARYASQAHVLRGYHVSLLTRRR
jgi:PAS domain S-box-containing protein